jgi:hypothetical protein
LFVQSISEDEWVAMLRSRNAMPPMPWPSVNIMSEADLRAIYRFVRSLGEGGEATPLAVPPDEEPTTPFIVLEPQGLTVVNLGESYPRVTSRSLSPGCGMFGSGRLAVISE